MGRRRAFALFAKDQIRPTTPSSQTIFSLGGGEWSDERSIHFHNLVFWLINRHEAFILIHQFFVVLMIWTEEKRLYISENEMGFSHVSDRESGIFEPIQRL